MSEEILAGRNSVTEALRSGRSINKLLVQDGIKGGSVSEIIGLAKTAGVVLEFCKAERLDKLADGLRHQGFVSCTYSLSQFRRGFGIGKRER